MNVFVNFEQFKEDYDEFCNYLEKSINAKGGKHMLVCDYMVEQIDGDYAHLRRVDEPDGELKLVARALLPMEITEEADYIMN